MATKDIGNGIQILDGDKIGGDPVGTLKNQLSLVGLVQENKLKQAQLEQAPIDLQRKSLELQEALANAPAERAIKDAEAKLKSNDAVMIDVANIKQRADAYAAQADARRKANDVVFQTAQSLPQLFGQSKELGEFYLAQALPGAKAVENPDGTFSIAMPGPNGAVRAFGIDPRKVADPEKLAKMEADYRKEWTGAGKNYEVQSQFFDNMQKLSGLATSQADIGVVYSYMKMLDPGSTVREGEAATAQNSPGVEERIRNMYNRALTTDAPLFGPAGSITRKNFIDAARTLKTTAEQDIVKLGQFYSGIATNSNLRAKNILSPVGDVTFERIVGGDAPSAGALNTSNQPAQSKGSKGSFGPLPREAGFAASSEPTARAPFKTLDEKLKFDLLRRK
jgi:hypothetical protein